MKRLVQDAIRGFHKKILLKPLSNKIGIYLHNVNMSEYQSFEELVMYFKHSGYRFVFPEEFVRKDHEDKQVFLSFDDNYFAWFSLKGLLDKLGIKATFFVNTQPIRDDASGNTISEYFDRLQYAGDRSTLSRAEIRELKEAGHNIGAHTHSHFMLTKLPLEKAKEEIRVSKKILEDIIGEEVTDFSYPFGMRRHFNEALRIYARSIQIKTISNAIPGLQYKAHEAMDINRTLWDLAKPLEDNIENLQIDGRVFVNFTGRSPVG